MQLIIYLGILFRYFAEDIEPEGEEGEDEDGASPRQREYHLRVTVLAE